MNLLYFTTYKHQAVEELPSFLAAFFIYIGMSKSLSTDGMMSDNTMSFFIRFLKEEGVYKAYIREFDKKSNVALRNIRVLNAPKSFKEWYSTQKVPKVLPEYFTSCTFLFGDLRKQYDDFWFDVDAKWRYTYFKAKYGG